MGKIVDGSVDLILCDLPYGTTACKWDAVIEFVPLWKHYRRVLKSKGAVVLTASQPFTSALLMSNPAWFKYEWVWNKKLGSGALNAAVMPMKIHENILVFAPARTTYNRQMRAGKPRKNKPSAIPNGDIRQDKSVVVRGYDNPDGLYNPISILEIGNTDRRGIIHPTQKPVALMEYLIRTYTHPGETVLDNCMGSGTTGVACVRTGRKFIGIEQDETHFTNAEKRIRETEAVPSA